MKNHLMRRIQVDSVLSADGWHPAMPESEDKLESLRGQSPVLPGSMEAQAMLGGRCKATFPYLLETDLCAVLSAAATGISAPEAST